MPKIDDNYESRYLPGQDFRIETRENSRPVLIGYAAMFNLKSERMFGFRERVSPGAFTDTLTNDDVRALIDHDTARIIGRNRAGTLRLKEDERGLLIEVDIPDTSVGRDLIVSVNRGDITGQSFGFTTLTDEWNVENGEDVRTLRKVKLYDVGPVTYPAYPDTTIAVRSFEKNRRGMDPALALRLVRTREI